ncbi:DUF4880 domain-containing protein [Pseudorhodoferax soli]|uniref:FecR family protein n=1 Tax=Pseudorhodoferax soli TaxID=545864 RepID=A0A368XRJ1_9BURK|nr:DUF4880 domain-containing protein [Pseudorhodoferax soli]RCW68624.1 FecR family protein [Pseudorhodoferax soli]
MTVSSPALHRAVTWRVRLDSGSATAEDRRALAEWLARDETHRAAWAQVGALLCEPIAQLEAAEEKRSGSRATSLRALTHARPSRRRLTSGLLTVAVLGGAGAWLVDRQSPLGTLLADCRTGTGQTRRQRLFDNSELVLGARSAADVRRQDGLAHLHLLRGQVSLNSPLHGSQDWEVHARHGKLRISAGHCFAQQTDRLTRFGLLSGAARIVSAAGATAELSAGQSASIDVAGRVRIDPDARLRAAWIDGLVDAYNEPLADVVEALRPYSTAVIRLDPSVSEIRVTAVLPLAEPEKALRSLAETIPISLRRFGPWVLAIGHA